MKILLLEPDKRLGDTYKRALQRRGHSVTHSMNAQSAVHLVDKTEPELIITELHVAQHNGVEFLYELRSYSEWQEIPVIVISNVPPAEQEILSALSKQLNVSLYLYKPLAKLSDITAAVEHLQAAPA